MTFTVAVDCIKSVKDVEGTKSVSPLDCVSLAIVIGGLLSIVVVVVILVISTEVPAVAEKYENKDLRGDGRRRKDTSRTCGSFSADECR